MKKIFKQPKKKILHLGCSWSEFNHEGQKGVPEHIVDSLLQNKINVDYYSASHGGCDLGTQFEVLKSELHNNYDFIVFQITRDNRKHIRIKSKNLDWFTTRTYKNIYTCDVSLREQFVFWNPNYEQIIDAFWSDNSALYKNTAKFSYYYDWDDQSSYFSYICSIKKILEIYSIPHCLYMHYKPFWEKYNKILEKNIVKLIDFDVQTFFGNQFINYVIDDGHHLSAEGNKQVAEQLIVPKIINAISHT